MSDKEGSLIFQGFGLCFENECRCVLKENKKNWVIFRTNNDWSSVCFKGGIIMNQLYKKNELNFSLLWIALYVILFSLADNISTSLGIEKIITTPLCIFFVVFLWTWIKKQDLMEKYGLCSFQGDVKKYLYFLPLILICTVNLWNGFGLNLTPIETILYVISMLCVGFIEEIIFRGFLFKAIAKSNIKEAILISSVTFGLGHIVNLMNGAEVFSTALQIGYAIAIGFLFTIIFYKGKSLIPCIISHGVLNSLSAFGVERSRTFDLIVSVVLIVISIGYAVWILQMEKRVNNAKD